MPSIPNYKHGLTKSPEHQAWRDIKKRCYLPHNPRYADYGGRGIKMCDRWRDNFVAFYEDMGPRPGSGYSIDRINTDGDYEPANCRWATRRQQMLSRRTFSRSGYRGVKQDHRRWAAQIGVETQTISLGTFDNAEEAAWMYDQFVIQMFGEDATTNFEYQPCKTT